MLIPRKQAEAMLGTEHNHFLSVFMEAPAFLRALLVADGTVTKLIEAYTLERLQVLLHWQQSISNSQAPSNLQLNRSDFFLHRKISLVGSVSSKEYLHAESWIDLNFFEKNVHQDFLQAKIGIGEIVQKSQLPTYRKIFNFFSEGISQQFFLGRTYVIHVNQQPAIQITEKFPLNVYELNACNE